MVPVPAAVLEKPKGGLFGGGKKALEDENVELRAALAAIGATEKAQLEADIGRLRSEHQAQASQLQADAARAHAELAQLRTEIVTVQEEAILQEVGIYQYQHPLDSAVAYKARLTDIQGRIKQTAKSDGAVRGATNWQVNGSVREGARMVKDFSKLMLRAYNNEADNAVRSLKPHTLVSATDRLEKSRTTISRLGKTMNIEIVPQYHELRIEELRLTADYLARAAEEKEAEREEKARLREEEKAQREFERQKATLLKEAAHYSSALAVMRANGDNAGVAEAEAKLAEITGAIEGVEQRAANIRAGYVYVISNVGAFGERMVKVGMTRRLDPMDRVRELGDASVPFRYDVHAVIFSDDAVELETHLHRELADRRVNLVNHRREFFYATPIEVRDILAGVEGPNLLSFEEHPEALEWHQSENTRSPR
jgi:Skp family chaperone for outer membrane proteins